MTKQMKSITLVGIAVLLLLTFAGDVNAKNLAGSRPNIVLIMTDDQGMGDLSCMGNKSREDSKHRSVFSTVDSVY